MSQGHGSLPPSLHASLARDSFPWPARSCLPYLLHVSAEKPVDDQVRPKERPLALNVLKELQLRGFVVGAVGILQRPQPQGKGLQDPLQITGFQPPHQAPSLKCPRSVDNG